MIRLLVFFDFLRRFRRTFQTKSFVRLLVFIALVLASASLGFWLAERGAEGNEGLTYLDSLWWTIVTMSTVGYGDFYPKTTLGRFAIGVPVMLIGGAILGYAISVITTLLMESKNREFRGMNKLALAGHIVIVNCPGEAKIVELVDELRQDPSVGKIVLVTDMLDMLPPALAQRDVLFVSGSPINAEVLERAAIATAKTAIVLARNAGDENSDSSNLGVIVTLHHASPQLEIVVECVNFRHRELMRKAGAAHATCVTELDVELLVQASHGVPIQEFLLDLASSRTPQRIDAVSFDAAGKGGVKFATLVQEMAGQDLLLVGLLEGDAPRINPGSEFTVPDKSKLLVVSAKRPKVYRRA